MPGGYRSRSASICLCWCSTFFISSARPKVFLIMPVISPIAQLPGCPRRPLPLFATASTPTPKAVRSSRSAYRRPLPLVQAIWPLQLATLAATAGLVVPLALPVIDPFNAYQPLHSKKRKTVRSMSKADGFSRSLAGNHGLSPLKNTPAPQPYAAMTVTPTAMPRNTKIRRPPTHIQSPHPM